MDEKEIRQKYNSKVKDSFKTKFTLFLFDQAVNHLLKENLSISNFEKFNISDDLITEYTNQYWQLKTNTKIRNKFKIEEIYNALKEWNNDAFKERCLESYKRTFEKTIYPLESFIKLFDSPNCCYCGITKKEIELIGDSENLNKKTLRGWNLEIERFNSNLEYTEDNCALACYWCNNAKTDEFTKEEFEPIGEEIRKIWEARLGKKLLKKPNSK